jgi:acyl transferase domain-containing protein/acyl carrier protein
MYSPDASTPGSIYVRHGMFLQNIDAFDPSAFRLTVAEATSMDPQQRLLLEQTSFALEEASQVVGSLAGTKTGVYAGCMYQEYTQLQFNHGLRINPTVVTGNGISYLVGRLSYTFGLAGPSVSTDTACSSSLVAAHQAHKGLLAGETVAAVAAGVNTMVLSITTASICGMGALSPVARCKTFDASADGYGRGEGFAVLVLAPGQFAAEGAVAVVRGSAINQDGRSSGLTAPNGPSQTTLIKDLINSVGLKGRDIGYVALHGTGTPLGDPIEVNALGQALRQQTKGAASRPPLLLGSVKSCYGHTEGAAGLTGALLAMQALHHGTAPAIMHLRGMNPYVGSALGDWPKRTGLKASVPRQLGAQSVTSATAAGTSSFGMGGTNTHLIIAVPTPMENKASFLATLLERSKLWPAPQPSHLLTSAIAILRSKRVVLVVDLLRPVLGSLFDHAVQGHALLPGAAFFDIAFASARSLDKTGGFTRSPVALECSILAPVMLSSQQKSMQLEVDISMLQGTLNIHANNEHFSCKISNLADTGVSAGGKQQEENRSFGQLLGTNTATFNNLTAFSTGSVAIEKSTDPNGYCLPPAMFDSCLHAGAILSPAGAELQVPTGAAAVSSLTRNGDSKMPQLLQIACSVDGLTSSYVAMTKSGSQALSIQKLASKAIVLKPQAKTHPIFSSSTIPLTEIAAKKERSLQYAAQLQASSIAPFLGDSGASHGAVAISMSIAAGSTALRFDLQSRLPTHQHLGAFLAAMQQGPSKMPGGGRVGLDTIQASLQPAVAVSSRKAISSAAVWGMARVASSEILAVKFSGIDAGVETTAAYHGGGALTASDLAGDVAQGGAVLKPLLLPTPTTTSYMGKDNNGGISGGRVLVTGGLGGEKLNTMNTFPTNFLQKKPNSIYLPNFYPAFCSGIGVLVSTWLLSTPAQEIVLLGRTGIFTSPSVPARLLTHNSTVTALRCDASAAEDVRSVFSAINAPLSGVFHAGGLLQDGILMKQTATGVRAVLAPKLTFLSHASGPAACNPVQQINLFSSVSGFLGSPGQANYAAANAGLDYWAHHAQHLGVASSSVQWGAWAEVGMAYGNVAVLTRVEKSGLGLVYPAPGLAALSAVLAESPSGRLVHTLASPFDFSLLLKGLPEIPPIFNAVLENGSDESEVVASGAENWQSSTVATTTAPVALAAVATITEDIQRAVSTMLGSDIPPSKPFMEAGLDSLTAVELRNELGSLFSVTMPATVIFDYPTIDALAGFVASKQQSVAVLNQTSNSAMIALNRLDMEAYQQKGTAAGVVSLSCRYPHSIYDAESFTSAAYNAIDLPQIVPWNRWNIDKMYEPNSGTSESIYARFGAFIEGVENFDAHLFGLPRQEAMAIDPQQRLLLEEAYGALTQAQKTTGALNGSQTGVYIGCMYHEYVSLLADSGSKLSAAAATGNSASFMVGRLSYAFGLAGPCISTDTACSSSLVATHLGHRSLVTEDATAAVAGGANLMLSATTTAAICQLQALSPVGRCKTFDASADGYGRGEGFALMVLSHAVADVQSLAILEASAVNQDGRSSSLTAPNGPSQTALVAQALRHASLDSACLAYVALHGTGTPLGDPIEVNALGEALNSANNRPLALGSIKSCYGHTEGAAGLTGLILAVKSAQDVSGAPIMHLRTTNAYVESDLGEWSSQHKLEATVPKQTFGAAHLFRNLTGTSSFGMSGVNAHAIASAKTPVELMAKKPTFLAPARLWPLPIMSALLNKVFVRLDFPSQLAIFDCNTAQAAVSFLWQQSVLGSPSLPMTAFLEIAVAIGGAMLESNKRDNAAVLNSVVNGLLKHNSSMHLQCKLDINTGSLKLADAAGNMHASAMLQPVQSSVSNQHNPGPNNDSSPCLSTTLVITSKRDAFSVATPAASPAVDARCGSLQQVQAGVTLAALNSQRVFIAIGCDMFLPSSSRQIGGMISASSTSLVMPALTGLVKKPLQALHREALLEPESSSSWYLTWQPTEFLPIPAGKEAPRWLTVGTSPCPLSKLCSPDVDGAYALSLNACWSNNTTSLSTIEINVSTDANLELLMRCCKVERCLFVEQQEPLPASSQSERAHMEAALKAMLSTYQAVLRSPKHIIASLVTFSAQEVPPFPSSSRPQPSAAVLQGVAKTLFMEDRAKYGPSIDLDESNKANSVVSSAILQAVMAHPGEFAAAVRGVRVYSQRLVRGLEPRARRVPIVKTAFVAGGSKVR